MDESGFTQKRRAHRLKGFMRIIADMEKDGI